MATLHLLGTGAPATDPHRTTTMLAFTSAGRSILIDCGGDVLQRVLSAGLDVDKIEALVLTHEHPDHVGGFSLFVEKMWLFGRRAPIPVYGPESALSQARGNFESFNTDFWEGMPALDWRPIPLEEGLPFLDMGDLSLSSSPTDHGVDSIAIRVDNHSTGQSLCYSSDTRPCPTVVRLGTGCNIMVHEASGGNPVHSTADEAAEIANQAGCSKLILVHLPAGVKEEDLINARKLIPDTTFAEELGTLEF